MILEESRGSADSGLDAMARRFERLSTREMDILCLVAEGATNREVGFSLHVSRYTVAQHIASMLRKTGCRTRAHLAYWAAKTNIIERQRPAVP